MFIFLDSAVAVALHIGQITALSLAPPQPAANAFDRAYGIAPFDAGDMLLTSNHLLKAQPFRTKTK